MKKVGIVVDNYKMDKFKDELSEKGFKFDCMPFTDETGAIFIKCKASRIEEISKLCKELELGFKRSN